MRQNGTVSLFTGAEDHMIIEALRMILVGSVEEILETEHTLHTEP